MANNNTTTENTTTENTTKTKVNTLEGWSERVASLNAYIKHLGEAYLEDILTGGFTCPEIKSVQNAGLILGVLKHCSSGYMGNSFNKNMPLSDKVEAFKKEIAPELTPEQVKARNLENAKGVIANLQSNGVAESVIRSCVQNMPQGKEALKAVFGA